MLWPAASMGQNPVHQHFPCVSPVTDSYFLTTLLAASNLLTMPFCLKPSSHHPQAWSSPGSWGAEASGSDSRTLTAGLDAGSGLESPEPGVSREGWDGRFWGELRKAKSHTLGTPGPRGRARPGEVTASARPAEGGHTLGEGDPVT